MKRKRNQIGALTLAIVAALFFALPVAAQVTIGSEQAPQKDALLDLRENTTDSLSSKGLLLPRVELDSTNAKAPLTAHVKGMLVYNTATSGAGATAVSPGVYYNDGTQWVATTEGQAAPATSSRLLVKEFSTVGPYSVSAADDNYLIVTYAATDFNFLTAEEGMSAADKGVIVRIMNMNPQGVTNSFTGLANSPQTGSLNGGIFVWTGKEWAALSKQ